MIVLKPIVFVILCFIYYLHLVQLSNKEKYIEKIFFPSSTLPCLTNLSKMITLYQFSKMITLCQFSKMITLCQFSKIITLCQFSKMITLCQFSKMITLCQFCPSGKICLLSLILTILMQLCM